MSSEEEIAWQFKPVFLGDSSHVNKAYVLSKHLNSQNLYFWDFYSFFEMIEFLDIVSKLLALLDLVENMLFDMWEWENGYFSDFEGDFEGFEHLYHMILINPESIILINMNFSNKLNLMDVKHSHSLVIKNILNNDFLKYLLIRDELINHRQSEGYAV